MLRLREPYNIPREKLQILSVLNYRLLPSSETKLLDVPVDDYRTVEVNRNPLRLLVI